MALETYAALAKYAGWIGALIVLCSTVGTTMLNDRINDKKNAASAVKDMRIDELLSGQKELATSVQQYQEELARKQAEINDLSRRATNSERGIRQSFDFDGTCRSQSGSTFTTIVGSNQAAFGRMCELLNNQGWSELDLLASSLIQKNSSWLTPFYMRAIAHANLGKLKESEQDLKYVIANAGNDKSYEDVGKMLHQVQQDLHQRGDH